jgi:hypothetical protein
MPHPYKPGVVVVYHAHKDSTHPGLHAEEVEPSPNGDDYSYAVDKFWRVDEALPDGRIVVRTRRGKRHTLSTQAPTDAPGAIVPLGCESRVRDNEAARRGAAALPITAATLPPGGK